MLEPGCNGVIADYSTIPRERVKAGYNYMMTIGIEEDEFPPEGGGGDEYYDSMGEFGGAGHTDHSDHTHHPNHTAEGGGDYDHHWRDEL